MAQLDQTLDIQKLSSIKKDYQTETTKRSIAHKTNNLYKLIVIAIIIVVSIAKYYILALILCTIVLICYFFCKACPISYRDSDSLLLEKIISDLEGE
ncbi:MAG: hypothetical protein V3V14_09015 [Saprospiraceae bacterium]